MATHKQIAAAHLFSDLADESMEGDIESQERLVKYFNCSWSELEAKFQTECVGDIWWNEMVAKLAEQI